MRAVRRRRAEPEACQPDRRRHVRHAALAAAGAARGGPAQCRSRASATRPCSRCRGSRGRHADSQRCVCCRGAARHGAGRRRRPPLVRRCATGRGVRRQGGRLRRARGAARRSTSCRSRRAPPPGIIRAAPARSSSGPERCSATSANSIPRRWKASTSPARWRLRGLPRCDARAEAKATRTKPKLELSPFQAVRRDFAFVVDKAVEAGR